MWSGKYRRYLYGSTVNPYRNDYFKLTSSLLVFMSSWTYIVLPLVFPLLILIESSGFHVYFRHINLFRFQCPPLAFIVLLLSFICYRSSSIHAACGRCDTISGILFQHWSFLLFVSSWDIHRSSSIFYPYWLWFWVFILGIFVLYSVLMFLPFPLFP